MPRALVLIEGVPGSGKTTTSNALADRYRDAGSAVGWALEEDRQHPFFGPQLRRLHRAKGFDQICLDAWREVVAACNEQPWILEGCAFQSTVRFMFEQAWPETEIAQYWGRFVSVVSDTNPLFVHLRPRDVESFVRLHTKTVRADVWNKIASHVLGTPAGRLLGDRTADAEVRFWVRYSELCARLLEEADFALVTVDVEQGWTGIGEVVAASAGLPVHVPMDRDSRDCTAQERAVKPR